uniref:desmoplakin-like n=1 Tax=Semicossyphus pulcher TaxID=241346 RepID=UPI0037E842C6
MELQRAEGEVEVSHLKQLVEDQEALLVERQAQLEELEEEVETQQKTIDDLTFQKSQLEHDVQQYSTKLEIAGKDKAASDEELSHAKQLIEQLEAKWAFAQKNLEDILKKTNDEQDLKKQSPKLQEGTEGLSSQENDHQSVVYDVQLTVQSEPQLSAVRESDSMLGDALKQKQEELDLVQKRAEMAEEKAQSYKKLLDDSNNRLKKLQTDMENERSNMRQKTEDVQQEAQNMKKSINELQEEIRSLQRAKSSLEQSTFFQSTEVEGLKEQLKISQGELHKKSSMEQENTFKISNLEEEVASKQVAIDQLKFKCNELTRVNVSSDSDIRGLQIQTESLEKERAFSEQKIKSLKSELDSWKQQLQTAKDENNIMKRSEQASQLKCKNLEAEIQKSELVASQLEKKVDELKQINTDMEKNLKNARAKLDQVTMEMDGKDQQIKILKSQAEGTKSQREKAEAAEKNISLGSEVRILKEKFQSAQTESVQKQKENAALQLRAQHMEEQLNKCKKMLEELKTKLELQKEGYERQLLLVQTEIEKKLVLLQSEFSGDKSKQKNSTEIAEMLNKYFRQVHTVHQTTVETRQQTDQQLHIKMDKLEQERNKLGLELSKAKSQIAQLEDDKLKLNSKMSAFRGPSNEQANELAKLKQLLTESERKLTLKDKDAKSLQEQIQFYVREIKGLQEKLSMLSVGMKSDNKTINKQEVTETIHHYGKANEAALLKTGQTATPSYLCAKCKREDEILKMKVSSKVSELKGNTSIQSLIKLRFLDEEVLRKLEMGLITMEEVQASLAQYTGKPTTIAGVYVESSKKKISFLEAAEKGFLAKTYALEFLEAQAASGSLTDLTTGQTHSVEEALERGIIETGLKDKLMEAQKAVSGYIHAGKKLSVFQAMEERILDRFKGKKILEVQVATGGLINPETGVRVPASIADALGIVSKEILQGLYDPTCNPKGFHNPDTGQKAYYAEILKTCLYDIDGGVFLFPFGERHLTNSSPTSSHRASVVISSSGIEMSAYEAFKGGHIDKRTYLFLSQQETEWQEKSIVGASGSPLHIITDARSGRQLCLESAVSQRYLETSELESYRNELLSIYEIADVIFSRMVVVDDINSPIAGLWDVSLGKRMSVLQGFQQGFTDRTTALRLLEAQACTGGICDPSSGERVTISDALQRGLLDEPLSQQLQQFEQAFNGIVHPKTSKTLSVSRAIQESLLPKDAGFRCIEFQILTGGLINPDTHDRASLEEVIQSGHVDKVTASALRDEKFQTKSLTCPKSKRRITFREALERSVYDCHTGLRLLEAIKTHGFGAKSTFHYIWAFRN